MTNQQYKNIKESQDKVTKLLQQQDRQIDLANLLIKMSREQRKNGRA